MHRNRLTGALAGRYGAKNNNDQPATDTTEAIRPDGLIDSADALGERLHALNLHQALTGDENDRTIAGGLPKEADGVVAATVKNAAVQLTIEPKPLDSRNTETRNGFVVTAWRQAVALDGAVG